MIAQPSPSSFILTDFFIKQELRRKKKLINSKQRFHACFYSTNKATLSFTLFVKRFKTLTKGLNFLLRQPRGPRMQPSPAESSVASLRSERVQSTVAASGCNGGRLFILGGICSQRVAHDCTQSYLQLRGGQVVHCKTRLHQLHQHHNSFCHDFVGNTQELF